MEENPGEQIVEHNAGQLRKRAKTRTWPKRTRLKECRSDSGKRWKWSLHRKNTATILRVMEMINSILGYFLLINAYTISLYNRNSLFRCDGTIKSPAFSTVEEKPSAKWFSCFPSRHWRKWKGKKVNLD